jgi:hypothetical protein
MQLEVSESRGFLRTGTRLSDMCIFAEINANNAGVISKVGEGSILEMGWRYCHHVIP